MAAMTKRVELEQIVWTWERRDQIRRFALWLPRALAFGLIGFGTAWLILRIVNAPLTITLSGASFVGLIVTVGVMVYRLRARPLMRAVRHFDQTLGLQERTSTALELLMGRIQTVDEIAAYQLDDAYRTAQQIDIRQAVPLVVKWREWLLLIPLLLALLLLMWGTQPPPVDALNPATRSAIETAADDVRDITESVANDTTLDAGERQTLLETLETSLDALEKEPLSAEEAFASLSQVEDALKNQTNNLRSSTQSENAIYEAAAQALNSENSSENESSDSGIAEFQKAIEQAQQDMASGSNADSMQQAMEQASQMMQNANPEMAKHLAEAAQAMEEGDTQSAQDALNQAAQEAQQAQSNQEQREATAQSLDEAAQNTSEAADNLAQSEQQSQSSQSGDQPQNQEGQGNQQQSQPGDQQPQEGQPSDQGQQSQPGDSSQQGSPGQSDQGNSDQGSPTEGENGQSSGDAAPSDNPGNQGAPDGQDPNSPSGAGGGAGDQSGPPQETSSSGGQSSQDNNPDGGGETSYEPIYAPQRITAEGSADMVLDPEASNQVMQEGEFQANSSGEARVPYNEVFREYGEAASQAIEGGYIPLSLRDVVQDYFTSIAPEEQP